MHILIVSALYPLYGDQNYLPKTKNGYNCEVVQFLTLYDLCIYIYIYVCVCICDIELSCLPHIAHFVSL